MIPRKLAFCLLGAALSVSSACKTTNSYEATFTIAPPEALPDTTLVQTDTQSDDLPERLAEARGIAFAPPEVCPGDAACDALMEALEASAAARGHKVIPWRSVLGQDSETLAFLGADILVEVTDFDLLEGRLSNEGQIEVELFDLNPPSKKKAQGGTEPRRLRYRKDDNGRLVPIEQASPSQSAGSPSRRPLEDPALAARVRALCISYDLAVIRNMVTSVEVRLGFKVRTGADKRVLWLYKGSATGSALIPELPMSFSRTFTITTDHSGNVQGAFAMVGLLTGVVGTVAAIPSQGETLEMAGDGFKMADESFDRLERVPPPFCQVQKTHGPGPRQISDPEGATERLRDLSLSDFFTHMARLELAAPEKPTEVPTEAETP